MRDTRTNELPVETLADELPVETLTNGLPVESTEYLLAGHPDKWPGVRPAQSLSLDMPAHAAWLSLSPSPWTRQIMLPGPLSVPLPGHARPDHAAWRGPGQSRQNRLLCPGRLDSLPGCADSLFEIASLGLRFLNRRPRLPAEASGSGE